MPYGNVSELPPAVRSKLKGKKLRQWMHVWNSAYDRHGDESRAFAEAWATVNKADGGDTISKDEAEYQGTPKGSARCSTCTMFQTPNSCSLVRGSVSPHGWCKFYEKSSVGKANISMSDFTFFMPIAKVNREKRTVSGYASTPTRDSDGEIVTLEAIKGALPDYMNWRNIREMHALKAVGTAEEANIDTRGLYLTAKIADDQAWKKCLEGVYKGFSIGGRKLAKDGDKITKLEMTEISVVDRPANPDCRITIAKSAGAALGAEGYLLHKKEKPTVEQKSLAKMAKIISDLAKAGPPAAHDGFSLPAKTAANASPKDDDTQNNKADGPTPCKEHGIINCDKCAAEKREFSADERREAASEGEALPDGSFPIKNVSDLENAIQAFGRAKDKAKAKAHIRSRARALNAEDKLPESWSKKSKSAKKLAKAELNKMLGLGTPTFLSLRQSQPFGKGMRTVGGLSYCFDSLREAQRSLLMEAKREGGDMKDKDLAKQLGGIAKQLAGVISQKATHEASEAVDLSDADDQFLSSYLGDDTMKTQKVNGTHGDPLTDALATMMKAAAQPTRAQRLEMAKTDVRKARKAMKECRKAIEEAHKMHKAAFLAKAAKKDGGKDNDGDEGEFDHTGAMEKLQKAYGALEKARTFGKAAGSQIAKAQGMSGRSGQRGQEVSDSDKFYEVPRGVKDLSPSDLATASPGGDGRGSAPPMYPTDGGVFPGKAAGADDLAKFAKDGKVSAEVVDLLLQKAKQDGELEALRRQPAMPSGGRRPFAFDLTKVMAGDTASSQNISKSLFDGVDPNALNGADELAHTQASARVIGNMISSGNFGKSVFDPNFRGAAGSGR